MKLDVSKVLVAPGQEVPFSLSVSLPEMAVSGETFSFPSPAVLAGIFVSIGEAIHLRGEMRFDVASRCVSCLKPYQRMFQARFDAVFVLSESAEDPDQYLYEGAWIDPQKLAEDTALLALPMRWICAEDCKGLCPVCGTDRNTTLCSCRMDVNPKHPFSALQQLLTEDESEV